MSSDPKRSARDSEAPAPATSYFREHLDEGGGAVGELDARALHLPPNPVPSSAALAAAVDEVDDFLERWIGCHFSLSVKLHDVRREADQTRAQDDLERQAEAAARGEVDDAEATERDLSEVDFVAADLDIVQGVLMELHDYASSEPRVRDMMQTSRVLQHGVIAVYAWLGEILAALPTRSVSRRRPSFVDEGETPAIAMLNTLERLHPDLERLVRREAVPSDADVSAKVAICFRQIGASIVRISGRATTRPPPR